ncbi:MAG: replication initiator protein A, partial [Agathobaculum butyriciproducens]
MPQAIFAYHLGMDAEQYAFFRIPKLLITEPYFRRLSTDAKLLYGLMLDRMSLSMKNGWMDDDGHVYIYFTLEEACEPLCCKTDKA